MGSLTDARTLGGIGSILVLLAIVPSVGPIISIVGLVLTLVAVKYISDDVGDKSIFNNMLISVGLGIAGFIAIFALLLGAIFSLIGLGSFSSGTPSAFLTSGFVGAIFSILLGLVVVWILFILFALFLRRSYDEIATKVGVGTFRTAGLLYLIGSGLTIILVGFVLLFVAQVLLIISFFSIPSAAAPIPQPYPATYSPPPPPSTQTGIQPAQSSGSRFCSKCGTSLAQVATFCPSCGEKQ